MHVPTHREKDTDIDTHMEIYTQIQRYTRAKFKMIFLKKNKNVSAKGMAGWNHMRSGKKLTPRASWRAGKAYVQSMQRVEVSCLFTDYVVYRDLGYTVSAVNSWWTQAWLCLIEMYFRFSGSYIKETGETKVIKYFPWLNVLSVQHEFIVKKYWWYVPHNFP